MVTFGLDVSHHQGSSMDFGAFRRAGVGFCFIKATEGSSWTDSQFAPNLVKARNAGMLVAAYHYVRDNATAAAQVANVTRMVPRDVPVIPDVEAGSGGVALVRDFVTRLRQAGYKVPLTYLPRWYWQQIGSPSLAGLPSLWSSRYPDNVPGSLAQEYAAVPASYWAGYGGLGVTVLQYSSSARVPGYGGNLDANAFLGTTAQLAAVLGGQLQEDTLQDDERNALLSIHAALFKMFNRATGQQVLTNGDQGDQSIIDRLVELQQGQRDLVGRTPGDIDESALANALIERGVVGITPAQIRQALRDVLVQAGNVPDPS